jgi:hypothetical protein
MNDALIKSIITIPEDEEKMFERMIKTNRLKQITSANKVVDIIFDKNPSFKEAILLKKSSNVITSIREACWQYYLEEEAQFNRNMIIEIGTILQTPKEILNTVVQNILKAIHTEDIEQKLKECCGNYAGIISPYIYALSLSNTQSRRSRSGSTFQSIIYKIYTILQYPFSSQKQVGKKAFTNAGIGKIVDSILPGIDEFFGRRDKVIIGTMKTSLRERWQEVSEEISRTNIPSIYLLTVDTDISVSKAMQMKEHNIILVVLDDVLIKMQGVDMKNVISFDEYFFAEIPTILKYWNYV